MEKISFQDYFYNTHSRYVRSAAIFGIVIYNAHLFIDFAKAPDHFTSIAAIRLFLTTPVIVMMIALLMTQAGRKRMNSITLGTSLAVTLSVLAIHRLTYGNQTPPQALGFYFTVIFSLCAMRMRTRDAVIYSAVSIVLFSALLHQSNASDSVWASNMTGLAVALAIGLATAVATNGYVARGYVDYAALIHEREKSERLLHKIIPVEIARKIRDNHNTLAERAECVTVLFADLAGFTDASSHTPPEILVKRLNEILYELDIMTEKHGCEKIKNIGDAYMAVCGVPTFTPDHAERVVRMAMEFLSRAQNLEINGFKLGVRIGIHSGPVIAGIIGRSRFTYDLWGDTVNVASRLESSAEVNTIHISDATVKLLQTRMDMEKNIPVNLKGIGPMDTWTIRLPKHYKAAG